MPTGLTRFLQITVPSALLCVVTYLLFKRRSSRNMVQDPNKLHAVQMDADKDKENSNPVTVMKKMVKQQATADPVDELTNGAAKLSVRDQAEANGTKDHLVKEWVSGQQQFSASADWDQPKPVTVVASSGAPHLDQTPYVQTKSFAETTKSKKLCPESPNEKQTTASDLSDERSEGSGDSGKGGSLVGSHLSTTQCSSLVYEFEIPQTVVGLFIGRQGRTVSWIERKSGATVMVRKHPWASRRDYQICSIEGTEAQIDRALDTIAGKFQELDLTQVNIPDVPNSISTSPVQKQLPLASPDIVQLTIPDGGVSVDAIISSIVSAGHIFIQQPTHPSFMSLDRLNFCMAGCYSQDDRIIPQLPRPIEVGVICACPLNSSWYRAQVVNFDADKDEADVRYLDYGGYQRVKSCLLRQIRSDFMALPFQSVECYLANIAPMPGEEDFSEKAAACLEQLTRGHVVQCRAVAMAEDHSPFVELLTIDETNGSFVSLNREMVARGVVQWVEATELVLSPA